jgi:hypothetical protein
MAGHDRITPEGKKFFKQIEELKKLQVRIGYQQGAATNEKGADMVDIAAYNELGTSRAPARAFMRQSADSNKTVIDKACKAQLQKVAQGGTAEQALRALGVMQTGLMQDMITNSPSWAIPNAPWTVAKKKDSDVPLIDSGKMLQSVHHVIVPKGSGE